MSSSSPVRRRPPCPHRPHSAFCWWLLRWSPFFLVNPGGFSSEDEWPIAPRLPTRRRTALESRRRGAIRSTTSTSSCAPCRCRSRGFPPSYKESKTGCVCRLARGRSELFEKKSEEGCTFIPGIVNFLTRFTCTRRKKNLFFHAGKCTVMSEMALRYLSIQWIERKPLHLTLRGMGQDEDRPTLHPPHTAVQ